MPHQPALGLLKTKQKTKTNLCKGSSTNCSCCSHPNQRAFSVVRKKRQDTTVKKFSSLECDETRSTAGCLRVRVPPTQQEQPSIVLQGLTSPTDFWHLPLHDHGDGHNCVSRLHLRNLQGLFFLDYLTCWNLPLHLHGHLVDVLYLRNVDALCGARASTTSERVSCGISSMDCGVSTICSSAQRGAMAHRQQASATISNQKQQDVFLHFLMHTQVVEAYSNHMSLTLRSSHSAASSRCHSHLSRHHTSRQ